MRLFVPKASAVNGTRTITAVHGLTLQYDTTQQTIIGSKYTRTWLIDVCVPRAIVPDSLIIDLCVSSAFLVSDSLLFRRSWPLHIVNAALALAVQNTWVGEPNNTTRISINATKVNTTGVSFFFSYCYYSFDSASDTYDAYDRVVVVHQNLSTISSRPELNDISYARISIEHAFLKSIQV